VQQRVIEWAAAALGAAAPGEIPASLSRVARFAPAKRARLARTALGHAVQSDPAFRALVAAYAARQAVQEPIAGGTGRGDAPHNADPIDADSAGAAVANDLARPDLASPDLASPDAAGPAPTRPDLIDVDPIDAAARGFLLHSPDVAALLAAAGEVDEIISSRAKIADLERQLRVLAGRLERAAAGSARGSSGGRRPDPDAGGSASSAEADRLRLRLRAQGTQVRELREQLAAQERQAADQLAAAAAELDRSRADADSWRLKAEAAEARAETAAAGVQRIRGAKDDRRATSDRRLELLLSALEGAAFGLRREWDLVGGGPAPADVIAAGLPRIATEAERTTDPARLTAWAGMPGAHLIVDGYNVTKTGFGELSLSDQRDRLVRMLSALAARTSAEVTIVFDGAAVAAVRPPARGIRVLFSPPGVLADDVIRDLVRAEPAGRTLIVVSSDREVVDRAAADGARTAASTVLLAAVGG
jgi:predicted RNA-binding protein with PIN domain